MVPQIVEEWTLNRTGMASSPASKTARHVLDQFSHLGYEASVGVVCGPMRIARPAWKSGLEENLTNVAAHLAYGLAIQLLTEEPPRQPDRRLTSDEERHAARVG